MEKFSNFIEGLTEEIFVSKLFYIIAAIVIGVILLVILVSVIVIGASSKSKEERKAKTIRPVINLIIDQNGNYAVPAQQVVFQGAPVPPAPLPEPAPAPVPAPAPAPAPVVEKVKAEPVVEKAKPAPVAKKEAVQEKGKLPYGDKVEFKVKLKKATGDVKKAFKELCDHIQGADKKIKTYEAKFHVCIKYLSYKLVEFKFVRSYLRAAFFVSSSEFKNYSKASDDADVKEKATVITLDGPESLQTCIHLVDMAYAQAKAAKKAKRK